MAAITTTPPPSTSALKQAIIRHPLVAFFVLAFAITWLSVLPMTLSRTPSDGADASANG